MTMIKCIECWKEIELKAWRQRCIKCSNKRDRETAAQRRATQESKDYYKEYRKNKKEAEL